jgi:hypothetical protein
MKKLSAGLLFLILASAGPMLAAEIKPENKPPITDAAGFVAKLPPKVFLLVTREHDRETLSIAIRALGATPGTEFFVLPKEATRPRATRQEPPIFPGSKSPGQAWIMALIDSSGRVTAAHSN